MIEIQGPALSGKTHLLYHILLAFLAFEPDPDAQIAAVVYDTDASFDIQRFRRLLLSRISRRPAVLDPLDSLRRSLSRLHVFRPTSLAQLATSIANLPAYHASRMPNQEIALLAVDSISAFYWPDRLAAEQLRTAGILPLHDVLDAIQSVRRSHGPLSFLTNWALNAAPSHSGSPYTQHLHPFPILQDAIADLGAKSADHSSSSPFRLAHHIALSSPSAGSSPPALLGNTLVDTGRHGREIIDNSQVSCLLRSSGTREAARFTIQITDDDILVQPQQVL